MKSHFGRCQEWESRGESPGTFLQTCPGAVRNDRSRYGASASRVRISEDFAGSYGMVTVPLRCRGPGRPGAAGLLTPARNLLDGDISRELLNSQIHLRSFRNS